MFALGGVQPMIKLLAFRGLPFTKTVGVIWVLSWFVIELLSLLSRQVDTSSDTVGALTVRQHAVRVVDKSAS